MSVFIKIKGTDYNISDYDVPSERAFRDAWTVTEDSTAISIDMEKAKEIWRNKIRDARKQSLIDLDAEYLRALETGGNTETISAKKQLLRDAPSDEGIDASTSPELLKFVQPLKPDIIIK